MPVSHPEMPRSHEKSEEFCWNQDVLDTFLTHGWPPIQRSETDVDVRSVTIPSAIIPAAAPAHFLLWESHSARKNIVQFCG